LPSDIQTCIDSLKFILFNFKIICTSLVHYMSTDMVAIIRCFGNRCWKLLQLHQCVQFRSIPSFMCPRIVHLYCWMQRFPTAIRST
jgi:hypothetical protein